MSTSTPIDIQRERDGPKPETATMRTSSTVSMEELVKIMEVNTLQDDPREKNIERSSKLVKAFLIKNEPEFVRVMGFRDRGWTQNKDKGDAFFKAQRERADNTDVAGEQRFFKMMIDIANEMQHFKNALSFPTARGADMKVLDICCAPGGYTAAVLRHNPGCNAFAITLPTEQGGHPLHVDRKQLAGLQLLDVTMLVNEYTDKPIPAKYPEKGKLLTIRPFKYHSFDLVFCDGMVLRTQQRESHREGTEVTRLATSQLILAMQRIKAGGTMIMLLHKIDSYGAAHILHTFSKFAKVDAFKPQKKHASRSSFYMVAKDVQPGSEAAKAAVQGWKELWYKTTFGGEQGTGERRSDPPESVVMSMLEDFGDRLMELGRPVWSTQADALSRTEYAGDGSIVPPPTVKPSPWSTLRENVPPTQSPKSPGSFSSSPAWGSLRENMPPCQSPKGPDMIPSSLWGTLRENASPTSPTTAKSWRELRENGLSQSPLSPTRESPWSSLRKNASSRARTSPTTSSPWDSLKKNGPPQSPTHSADSPGNNLSGW